MDVNPSQQLDIVIRLATMLDLEPLLRFYISMWQTTYAGLVNDAFLRDMPSNPKIREAFASMLAPWRDNVVVVLALHGTQIVGMAAGGPCRYVMAADEAENYALYIDQRYQRRGIGHRLWSERAGLLQRQGAVTLNTWVLEPNQKAQARYREWGAKPAEPWQRMVQFGTQEMAEVHYSWDIKAPFHPAL